MTTNAIIGILNNSTNKVEYTTCYSDGYPEYTGKMLKEHYTTKSKVEKLIRTGEIKLLESTIEATEYFGDVPDFTTSFHSFLPLTSGNHYYEYVYIFMHGGWRCWPGLAENEIKEILL